MPTSTAVRIDLISDTSTRPTPEMRRAMVEAEVGDEQRSEDPIVNMLCERTAELMGQEAALMTQIGPARLKLVLDNHLWTGVDHLGTKQLWEYLASYLYLPRFKDSNVLVGAIQAGISELVGDHFGYAERFDEDAKRYEGLKLTGGGSVLIDSMSVVVKPEIAEDLRHPLMTSPGPTRT